MSSDVVIQVENLGKRYRIRHQAEGRRYTALRDVLAQKANPISAFRFLLSAFSNNQKSKIKNQKSTEDFWALKDVSFEVKQGEVLGIIGRNGAGKSTLLKILSRITEPTEGRVRIRGRVASLLEVGTGFHPELTGRENIFLNGAILGMTRSEIRKKFDEIVAFAEVEKFLDTPVKRYSSGMYVRLAFAVAAHLEPEILVVDEVLAVGDAEFQKKCLGRMGEVAQRDGRTVLFVSHNMAAIHALTHRGVLLDRGRIGFLGSSEEAVREYLRGAGAPGSAYRSSGPAGAHEILEVSIPSLGTAGVHQCGSTLRIRVAVRSSIAAVRGCLSIQVANDNLQPVLHFRAYDHNIFFGERPGETILICDVDNCNLNVGHYALNLFLSGPPGGDFFQHLQGVCPFDVEVHDRLALFGWRSHACAYIVQESWSKE